MNKQQSCPKPIAQNKEAQWIQQTSKHKKYNKEWVAKQNNQKTNLTLLMPNSIQLCLLWTSFQCYNMTNSLEHPFIGESIEVGSEDDDGYSNDVSTLLANVTKLNGTKFTNLSGLLFTILCDIFRKLCKRNSLKSKIKFIMVIIGIISCISE